MGLPTKSEVRDLLGLLLVNRDGEMPMRMVESDRGGLYMVVDWSVNHDDGDEDDGESKAIAAWLARPTPTPSTSPST